MILVALPGNYGKPRPAAIVQSDRMIGTDSILICPFTSDLEQSTVFRLMVEPGGGTGLHRRSQLMVDKIYAVRREKCSPPIGHLNPDLMVQLDECLTLALGLADEED